jgi:tetratricopeptide (TPR) repeat protein
MKNAFSPPSAAAVLLLAVALFPIPGAGQEKAEDQNVEEIAAYMAWYGASTAGETEKALAAAKEYLAKYPKAQNADYVRKWMVGLQWKSFNEAVQKKDMAGMVRIGRTQLSSEPRDPGFAYWMAWYLRQNELLGAGDAAHAKDAEELSRIAIDFVEKGGVATGIDPAKWNKQANLAWLHQNLALVAAKDDRLREAIEHYEASSRLAPGDAALNARNHLGCGSVNKSLYDRAVAKYQGLPEAERSPQGPSEAARQALDTVNRHADAAIECWARFLAGGSGSAELRSRIEAAIAALWSYRHPEEPEGWKALVATAKAGA